MIDIVIREAIGDMVGEVIGDEIGEVILAICDWRDVRSERLLETYVIREAIL